MAQRIAAATVCKDDYIAVNFPVWGMHWYRVLSTRMVSTYGVILETSRGYVYRGILGLVLIADARNGEVPELLAGDRPLWLKAEENSHGTGDESKALWNTELRPREEYAAV